MSNNTKKISKFWLCFNVFMTVITGGAWLFVVLVWYLMKKA